MFTFFLQNVLYALIIQRNLLYENSSQAQAAKVELGFYINSLSVQLYFNF